MKIDNDILRSYLACKYEAYLRLSGQAAHRHPYNAMLAEEEIRFRRTVTERLFATAKQDGILRNKAISPTDLQVGFSLLLDVTVETSHYICHFDAMQRKEGKSALGSFHYIPVVFRPERTVREDQKLTASFAGSVLEGIQGLAPPIGRTVGLSFKLTTVRLESSYKKLRALLLELRQVADGNVVPPFALTDHCDACDYRQYCEAKARTDDHLSLLRRITKKQIQKYAAKGIFTVTQLSYTFRPRRRSKRQKGLPLPYSFALQSQAIRENRTYVIGVPQVAKSPTHVYFDIEGDSAGKSVYLIGLLVVSRNSEQAYSFWADGPDDQGTIFEKFVDVLSQYKNFILFHYGSYEVQYLKRMKSLVPDKAKIEAIIEKAVNLVSLVYAKIYFPTRSNSLKEIGRHLGFSWSEPDVSGLHALVWRHRWEQTGDDEWKQRLLKYNQEDCLALKRLTEVVYDIAERKDCRKPTAGASPDVAWVEEENPFPRGREWNTVHFQLPDFDYINKCAYFDYQRDRIYLRTSSGIRQAHRNVRRRKHRQPRPNCRIVVSTGTCPKCGRSELTETGQRVFVKRALNLRITPSGVLRKIVEYRTKRLRCPDCRNSFLPHTFRRIDPYRHSLKSWVMYLHVAHQVSLPKLQAILEELFGIRVETAYIHMMKAMLARRCRPAYNALMKSLLAGRLIHVDETEIKLKLGKGYVWVLTNMEEVVFLYRPTREGDWLKETLATFRGVLVSDFYAAYDSVDCRQQKCLIHLMRDFNNDILGNAFNDEFKAMASEFAGLLRPMVDTIDRRGLKKRWLGKHKKAVDRFFASLIPTPSRTELAEAYRQKLLGRGLEMGRDFGLFVGRGGFSVGRCSGLRA